MKITKFKVFVLLLTVGLGTEFLTGFWTDIYKIFEGIYAILFCLFSYIFNIG